MLSQIVTCSLKSKRSRLASVLFAMTLACSATTALADVTINDVRNDPSLLKNTDPGAYDLTKKFTAPEENKDPQKVNVDDSAANTQDNQAGSEQKFLLKNIDIEGITLLDEKKVQRIVAEYKNQEVSLNQLFELTNKLNQLYREKGYLTSRVYLPPQKVEEGSVKLRALEGTIGKIEIDEPSTNFWGFRKRAITPRIDLEEGENFDLNDLRRSIILLGDNPDLQVRAKLKPGAEQGQTDIGLSVANNRPYHLTLSADNLGRDLIGQTRGGATLTHNNFLGFGDRLTLSGFLSRSSQSAITQYAFPIGRKGTEVGVQASSSFLKLRGPLESANIQGSSQTYSLYVKQPLITRERLRFSTDLAFDWREMDTNFSKQDLFHDSLRVLRWGQNLDVYDRYGRTIVRNELGLGFDIFGATNGNSTLGGATSSRQGGAGSQFFRWSPSVTRIQKLPFNTFGIFRAIGQYSPNELVSAEQFQAGGTFTVRGYKEGRVVADSGLILSGEWRIPAFFLPKDKFVPFTNGISWRDAITFVTFADLGYTYLNGAPAGTEQSELLLGVGGGLRLQLTRFASLRLDLGIPLLSQTPENNSPRLHFGLDSTIF